jgi:hypothetical protein
VNDAPGIGLITKREQTGFDALHLALQTETV